MQTKNLKKYREKICVKKKFENSNLIDHNSIHHYLKNHLKGAPLTNTFHLFFPRRTVSFTDLDQGREILSRFSLPKSMKHSVCVCV